MLKLHLNRLPLAPKSTTTAPKSSAAHGGRPCRPRGRPPLHPSAHKATHIRTHPPTILAHQPTKQPTATAHQPTEPRTSCLPAMQPYERAAQPRVALPPCNATLLARLPAGRRFASLQCLALARPPPSAASVLCWWLPCCRWRRASGRVLLRRPRVRCPAGGHHIVVTSGIVVSPLRAIIPSRASHFFATHAHRAPLAFLRSAAGARRASTLPLQCNPAFASHGQGIIRP